MIGAILLSLLAAAPTNMLQDELRAKDQALLDAIAPGDTATWDKALAPDAVYVDENGSIMDRAAFLKALQPLPPEASGHIHIVDYRLQQDGDTALVIHKDDEREVYNGIPLHADYLMTETWLRRSGAWQLALVHAYVVAVDPPAVALPATKLDDYVGRYQLAPGVTYVIARKGDHLVGGTQGKTQHPLLAEAPDLFFLAGQPRSRKLFRRGPDNKVIDFVDRREGEDLIFRREK
jgi:ketosteroid isomerase-like protein